MVDILKLPRLSLGKGKIMNGALLHGSWKIITIWGIPIRVHFSWLIVFGMITWSLSTYYFPKAAPDLPAASQWLKGAIGALLLFASVTFHELAHSFVSRKYRITILSITLFIFGGVAQMKGEPPTPKAELRIAIAGPLSSFLLSGVFFTLYTAARSPGMKALYVYLAQINLILGTFNLIPGFPMDGGRVLRSIIWEKTKDYVYATKKASGLGQKVALFFIFFGLFSILTGFAGGFWLMLVGWFLYTAAQSSYQQASLQETLSGVKVKEVRDVPREDWVKVKVLNILIPRNSEWEVSSEDDTLKALELMIMKDKGRLAVTDNDKIIGLITRNGIARYIQIMEK